MSPKVKPIPEGYHSVIPYLSIKGAADALAFYCKVFGATEIMRMPRPDGRIGHAEIKIGDSYIMLADECPEMSFLSPKTIGGSPISLMVYIENVDETVQRAVAEGGKLIKAVENQFYGDRSGCIEDPFGHIWLIATHIEDVPPEELKKRAAEWAQKNNKSST